MSSRTASRRGASKAAARKKPAKQLSIPGWLYLLTGFAAGFFVAFLIRLTPSPVAAPQVASSSDEQQTSREAPNPVFDFYTLLPESEVILPEIASQPKPEQKVAEVKPAAEASQQQSQRQNSRYLLQAGSFRSPTDADRLRAQLLLAGLAPRVEKVNVGAGESWHRVQLGPFDNRGELEHAQKQLADMRIDSLLLKLK